jgi:transcriptional regulator with XRE-family HTH domain
MIVTSPTIRRKRLSNSLRELRREAGLTAEQVATQLGWDPSKISRIESNEWKLPKVKDVEALLDVYGVTDPAQKEALATLARQARERGWWERYKDVLGSALPGLETEATQIRTYQPILIPGLLQTPDYIRAICRAGMCDEDDTERRVEARIARQQILYRDQSPTLWAVLDEAALRKLVGGREVMRDQVHHLLDMQDHRSNIWIQVIPDSIGAHASMGGPIVLLDYAADPTIVFLENPGAGDLFLEQVADVARYNIRYSHVTGSALSVEESTEYLKRLLERLKGQDHDQPC